MTLPAKTHGIIKDGKVAPIKDILIDNPSFNLNKITRRIEQTESKKKYFDRLRPLLMVLDSFLESNLDELCFLNEKTTSCLCRIIDHSFKGLFVSDQNLTTNEEDRIERLNRIIKEVRGTEYLAGRGFLNYLNDSKLDVPIKIQTIKENTSSESVITVIASEPDPLDYIMNSFGWESI
jgi:hypothetical protein